MPSVLDEPGGGLLNCDFTQNTASTLGPIITYVGNLGQTITITGTAPGNYILDPNL